MELGIEIKKKRLNKGFSQDYMAGQIGVSLKTYRNIEDGRSKIYLKRLEIISHILEIDPFDLIKTDASLSFYKGTDNSLIITYNKEIKLYENLLRAKDALIKHLEIRLHDLSESN